MEKEITSSCGHPAGTLNIVICHVCLQEDVSHENVQRLWKISGLIRFREFINSGNEIGSKLWKMKFEYAGEMGSYPRYKECLQSNSASYETVFPV
jgi:hypothetical protein